MQARVSMAAICCLLIIGLGLYALQSLHQQQEANAYNSEVAKAKEIGLWADELTACYPVPAPDQDATPDLQAASKIIDDWINLDPHRQLRPLPNKLFIQVSDLIDSAIQKQALSWVSVDLNGTKTLSSPGLAQCIQFSARSLREAIDHQDADKGFRFLRQLARLNKMGHVIDPSLPLVVKLVTLRPALASKILELFPASDAQETLLGLLRESLTKLVAYYRDYQSPRVQNELIRVGVQPVNQVRKQLTAVIRLYRLQYEGLRRSASFGRLSAQQDELLGEFNRQFPETVTTIQAVGPGEVIGENSLEVARTGLSVLARGEPFPARVGPVDGSESINGGTFRYALSPKGFTISVVSSATGQPLLFIYPAPPEPVKPLVSTEPASRFGKKHMGLMMSPVAPKQSAL